MFDHVDKLLFVCKINNDFNVLLRGMFILTFLFLARKLLAGEAIIKIYCMVANLSLINIKDVFFDSLTTFGGIRFDPV